MPLLIGPLAHPALRSRLAPDAQPAGMVAGQLRGGARAGILADCFPGLVLGAGGLQVWRADWTPALRRYAAIFGLKAVPVAGRMVLGLGQDADDRPWQADLAGAMADWLLRLPDARSVDAIRHRLPNIAGWVASRQRAGRESADLPQIGPTGKARWELMTQAEPYANYFAMESLTLRHMRNRGDWTPALVRAVFVSGDATVVLPWDPVRDRVLLIDQFRAGPAARGDLQPWLCETVAGRVDPGEPPAAAAMREAREEAGLDIRQLIPGPHNYPSPGAMAEFLYLYVGITDLPDGVAGLGGLDSEDEDIRSHILPRAELTRMAVAGEIRNGPLLNLAFWLELSHDRIRGELARPGPV